MGEFRLLINHSQNLLKTFLKILLPMLVVALSGCSAQTLNSALFSIGEQAGCAQSNDNRVDEQSRRATCLAETSLSHDYKNYKKARDEALAE